MRAVRYSPGGLVLASSSADRTIRVWNWQEGQEILQIFGHQSIVKAIEFSSDGTILASASADNVAAVWEVQSGRLLHAFGDSLERDGEHGLYSIALSPDGKILGSAGTATTIDLWRLE